MPRANRLVPVLSLPPIAVRFRYERIQLANQRTSVVPDLVDRSDIPSLDGNRRRRFVCDLCGRHALYSFFADRYPRGRDRKDLPRGVLVDPRRVDGIDLEPMDGGLCPDVQRSPIQGRMRGDLDGDLYDPRLAYRTMRRTAPSRQSRQYAGHQRGHRFDLGVLGSGVQCGDLWTAIAVWVSWLVRCCRARLSNLRTAICGSCSDR